MIYSLSILGKNDVFLASNFLIFVSNRFSMLQIFYKRLSLGIILKIVYEFERISILKVA